jgi:hypothetical protein
MSEPKLTVLGVYRPVISAETWHKQREITKDDAATQEHFDKLVLIEAVVEGLTEPFLMGELGQMHPEHPDDPSSMQVGYEEGLLSAEGESLIERGMESVRGTCPLRFAVYLHLYDPQRPLRWQHGEVKCPPIQDAPPRLMKLMPYTPCD